MQIPANKTAMILEANTATLGPKCKCRFRSQLGAARRQGALLRTVRAVRDAALPGQLAPVQASCDWVTGSGGEFVGRAANAIAKAIEDHAAERADDRG